MIIFEELNLFGCVLKKKMFYWFSKFYNQNRSPSCVPYFVLEDFLVFFHWLMKLAKDKNHL